MHNSFIVNREKEQSKIFNKIILSSTKEIDMEHLARG
jgi:hypothetical protein